MSDLIINPKTNPQLAAQQLVIELIRAGRLHEFTQDGDASYLINLFDQIEKHFTEKYAASEGASLTRIK
ncbi:hypothetical protein CYR40_05730 [Chimaeribacter arupi]|uniref:hypothetical protein n=1 Tax=Chimaeribacter arupi TaxID=2060066 RepID=UPI000C7C07BC|nr:hypothetical protein [Chimaeribacter arupi]MDV5140823.1 hypothetical protein [Chimaeribacter arupi]PLR48664.1 hypothetical protein CYR40_05730 [Chimaeribacter arupi]